MIPAYTEINRSTSGREKVRKRQVHAVKVDYIDPRPPYNPQKAKGKPPRQFLLPRVDKKMK